MRDFAAGFIVGGFLSVMSLVLLLVNRPQSRQPFFDFIDSLSDSDE